MASRTSGLCDRPKNLDEHTVLFVGALHSSLIGFVVGALFAPEAYQFFPFFAVAFTSTLLQTLKEREREPGTAPPSPNKPRHFLEVYADHGTTGAVSRLSADLQAILRCLSCGAKLESDQCRRLLVPGLQARLSQRAGHRAFCGRPALRRQFRLSVAPLSEDAARSRRTPRIRSAIS